MAARAAMLAVPRLCKRCCVPLFGRHVRQQPGIITWGSRVCCSRYLYCWSSMRFEMGSFFGCSSAGAVSCCVAAAEQHTCLQ